VRPEGLNPAFSQGANNLNSRVDAIMYLGSIVRIRVAIEGQPVTLDIFNERKLKIPTIGVPYQVAFPVDACWLL
jgi:putative spermidine/putrescine transport system ATP-binding protein